MPKHSANITGSPLASETFILESMHFHWGHKDTWGAEHVVDGDHFSVELHFVHRNSKYATIDEAIKHKNGLTVLAVFFQVKVSHPNTQDSVVFKNSFKFLFTFYRAIKKMVLLV